jgi:hypothetical protein
MMSFFEALEPRRHLTTVSVSGTKFFIDGRITLPGSKMQGMLPNIRAANAIADDENPETRVRWKYPDTGQWDPERNLREFIANLPSWKAKGALAVDINLQGGWPTIHFPYDDQPLINTAITPDGSLKEAYMNRLERAVRALDQNGMVCILGVFYYGQDHRLTGEAAIKRAVDNTVDWIKSKGFNNVILELVNEATQFYQYPILKPPRVVELMTQAKTRSGGSLLVTTSLGGGHVPSQDIVNASDIVLLHGNGQPNERLAPMVQRARALAPNKPIVFNEDTDRPSRLNIVVNAGASFGYYDLGGNDYVNGLQALPVNYAINASANKRAFFDALAALAKSGTTPTPPPPPPQGPPITRFMLIDANGKRVIGELKDNMTIDLSKIGTSKLSVQARTDLPVAKSVRFGLDGNSNYRTENSSPWALGGDANGKYHPVKFSAGKHTLFATAYTGTNATGIAGAKKTVRFTLVQTSVARPPAQTFSLKSIARNSILDDASPVESYI